MSFSGPRRVAYVYVWKGAALGPPNWRTAHKHLCDVLRRRAFRASALALTRLPPPQTVLLVLTYIASPLTFAVAVLEVACVTLLTVQPMYDGPTRVEALTPATMPVVVTKAPAERRGDAATWVVMMHASWSASCAHFAPAFARLSRKYATDGSKDQGPGMVVRFGALDLSVWPGMASKFNMDLNATSSQLPTCVLYKGGQEVDRLPRVGAKGRWTAADVERIFGLGQPGPSTMAPPTPVPQDKAASSQLKKKAA